MRNDQNTPFFLHQTCLSLSEPSPPTHRTVGGAHSGQSRRPLSPPSIFSNSQPIFLS